MTHDTTQPDQDDSGAPASKAPALGNPDGDSLPEILEVFGAAPLVPDGDLSAEDAAEAERRRDAAGRFVSVDEEELDDSDFGDDAGELTEPVHDIDMDMDDLDELDELDEDELDDAPRAADDPRLDALQGVCERLVDQLSLSEDRLARIETSVEELARQTSFLPPKLRGLGSKVDDLTNGLGDERSRGLLEDVVAVLDLVDGARQRFAEDAEQPEAREARRYLDAMATRIGQILEGHEVREIETDGAFDPERHHAIERVDVSRPEQDGAIVSVVRRGWAGGGRVLRYADVTVGSLSGDAGASSADAEPSDDASPEPTEPQAASAPAATPEPEPELEPNELDALTPPPGEAPKTVTDTDSASITFRPTQRRNRG